MTEFKNANQPSKRARAAQRAGAIRRRRIAEVREREALIEQTVVLVLAARLAIEEAQWAVADGVEDLKRLGESQDSIVELCEMTPHEVRAALTRKREATAGTATGVARTVSGTMRDVQAEPETGGGDFNQARPA